MLNKEVITLNSKVYLKHASIYSNSSLTTKAVILYFHGGGLLYGQRDDLPDYHIQEICNAGYRIIAFDYPLAPVTKLQDIMNDIEDSIHMYIEQPQLFSPVPLPYFLWGRSAGAYLCLLAASHPFVKQPLGVISYYGYGFLTNDWFNQPSPYYCKLPRVSEECITPLSDNVTTIGTLENYYCRYVYARQQGKWINLFFDNREKFFYKDFSLRFAQDFSMKQSVFLAHSTNDTDVPYQEFQALCNLFKHSEKYIVSDAVHDFDRYTDTASTKGLISKTINFLNRSL